MLDLRRTKSTENLQTKDLSEVTEADMESLAKNDQMGSAENLPEEKQPGKEEQNGHKTNAEGPEATPKRPVEV